MKKIFLLTVVAVALFGINNSIQAQNLKLGADGLTLDYDETDNSASSSTENGKGYVKLSTILSVDKEEMKVWSNGYSSIPTIELGWNLLSNVGYDAYAGANAGEFFNIREWKSTQVTVNLFNFDAYHKVKKIGFSAAIGIRANNYRLATGQSWKKVDGLIMPYTIEPYNERSPKKSKFNIATVHIPVEINFGNPHKFAFAVGGYVDMVMNSHTKIKFDGGHKDKVHNFPTNFIQAGATARVVCHGISVFCSYQPTQIFKSGRGPEAQQWTIGIGF